MIREALRYLVDELGPVRALHLDDHAYTERPVHLPPAEPEAVTVRVSTLSSFVDYLAANRDALDLGTHAVHVVDPAQVRLLGPLSGRHRSREVPLVAKAAPVGFPVGEFVVLEEFIIRATSRILPTDDRDEMLAVLRKVKAGATLEQSDDGLSQAVEGPRSSRRTEAAGRRTRWRRSPGSSASSSVSRRTKRSPRYRSWPEPVPSQPQLPLAPAADRHSAAGGRDLERERKLAREVRLERHRRNADPRCPACRKALR